MQDDNNVEENKQQFPLGNYMRQGPLTNTLTKVLPSMTGKAKYQVDPVSGCSMITADVLTVTLPPEVTIGISTYQLLDALIAKLTSTGTRESTVKLTLADYMIVRNLKDERETRKQVKADLDVLLSMKISFEEVFRGKEIFYPELYIAEFGEIRRSTINLTFTETFFDLLKRYNVMPVQPQLWTLNAKRNPGSYFLLRKIAEQKNMNVGKSCEDIISVRKLLEACPTIPDKATVMKGDRAVRRRIIQPFERDMNALSDTLSWRYCRTNKVPLTEEEVNNMDFSAFEECFAKVSWRAYPDQTERLERKAKRIEESKKRSISNRGNKSKEALQKKVG